ncbi:hypothetical protein [Listeria rocourtiae]|uniref:hypothetical protein n=1 Tax=Listeria rocourtiae TaxID=647910 RepID=UPI003D2F8FCE
MEAIFGGLLKTARRMTSAYEFNKQKETAIKKVGELIKEAASTGKTSVYIYDALEQRIIDLKLTSDLVNEGFELMKHEDSTEISWAKK